MEGYSRKDERCPQLLDLISKDSTWLTKSAEQETRQGLSEERKLELRLGPPGEHWAVSRERNSHDSLSSFPYFANTPWQQQQHQTAPNPSFLVPVRKEPSQACSNRGEELQTAEKKKAAAADTAVHNSCSSQKRTAPASVVGWPPIRSFRKNIANGSNSSKLASDSPEKSSPKSSINRVRSPFVKINMDGVPIGRKVDLKAYGSYEKLSLAVDELFKGLLAAQSDSCGIKDKDDGGKEIGGLLDGSGEYTLVYEDNEGDRMLVGDVPWNMFVSTVKRLRVLKSSELPMLSREKVNMESPV